MLEHYVDPDEIMEQGRRIEEYDRIKDSLFKSFVHDRLSIDVVGGEVIVTTRANEKILIENIVMYNSASLANKFAKYPRWHKEFKGEKIRKEWEAVGDELGCSAKSLAAQLNGAIFRAYIEPNQDLLDRLAWVDYRRNPQMAKMVVVARNIIRGYEADNMHNVSAFGMYGMDAQAAKKALGKKLWKRVCSNSRTRNDMIVRQSVYIMLQDFQHSRVEKPSFRTLVDKLNEVPSTLLRNKGVAYLLIHSLLNADRNIIVEIVDYLKRPLKHLNPEVMQNVNSMIYDAKSSLEQLGKPFDDKWSLKRIKREHDAASKELLARRYGPDPFPYVGGLNAIMEKDGLTATLVRSPMELHEIGRREMHCVHTYTDMCLKGDYIVFDITDSKGKHSTLGFGGKYHYAQHMYERNVSVDDPARISFADWITKAIGEVYDFEKENIVIPAPDPDPAFEEFEDCPITGGACYDCLAGADQPTPCAIELEEGVDVAAFNPDDEIPF